MKGLSTKIACQAHTQFRHNLKKRPVQRPAALCPSDDKKEDDAYKHKKDTADEKYFDEVFHFPQLLRNTGADDKRQAHGYRQRNKADRPVVVFYFLVHLEFRGQKFE